MRISFYGATREVTGSCFCVEADGKKVLVDCGLQQGGSNGFGQSFPFHPGEIDYVIITHAHIDHSGRLPLLVKNGFKGGIFATEPTCKLLDIMLRDSAHIQELEALWSSRKKRRAGAAATEPLYTMEDALRVFPLLIPCRYGEKIEIDEAVSFLFTDAGHLLGSAYVEMWLTEDNTEQGLVRKKIVFSGDIGTPGHPIIREPEFVDEADIVVMESTYGDRSHAHSFDTVTELAKVIEATLAKGGNVICPSFAIGRTQDLLYHIREIKEKGLVRSVPDFPVYLDSPLAKAATKLYSEELTDYLNDETLALIESGVQPLAFDGLVIIETSEDSKRLNDDKTPKVIISSSGMCDAGRIRHHLKHNLWRQECAVVFTGFQALGTLGRIIVDGIESSVSLFGEEIAIRCQIHNFRSMSSHADKGELLHWIGSFIKKPECVFVVHGEEEICNGFTLKLIEEDFKAIAPKYTSIYDLLTFEAEFEGRDLLKRSDIDRQERRDSPVFQRLMLAGLRLVDVISRNKGGTNKDLAKFADQVDSLSNKWDR
ncbi:MAG: MBL fold metallo-hydrolase [Oscillospiraceae bacterium]|nr:MBL fold metallo-hydrolase [Oscillospiraceae bacterium]